MPSVQAWESQDQECCQHFMLSLVATQHQGQRQEIRVEGLAGLWEIRETFEYLACHSFELLYVNSAHFEMIERLTVILYDKSSPLSSVNQTRKEIFCLKNQSNATNTGCSTAAYPTGSVPSWNLDHQLTDSTSGSFSPGICLGQGI